MTLRAKLWGTVAIPLGMLLGDAPGAFAQTYNTPAQNQTLINSVPWTNGQNQVTGNQLFTILTSINGTLNLYAAKGVNSDITSLLTLTGQLVASPALVNAAGSPTVAASPPQPSWLSFTSPGYPAYQQGTYVVNQWAGVANQPLKGSTQPGSGSSQTYNLVRARVSVAGPGGFDAWGNPILGYKGSELKVGTFILSVTNDLGTTDNGKSDLVGLATSHTGSFWYGDHTQYAFNFADSCNGPSSAMPPGPIGTAHCWVRQQVGAEGDISMDAAIPPTSIDSVTYDSTAQTLTYVFNTPVPPQIITKCPAAPVVALGATDVSSNVALPNNTYVVVTNAGPSTAFTTLGATNSVTATLASDQILSGGWISYRIQSNNYIAGITGAAGSAALSITGGSNIVPRTDSGPPLVTCQPGQFFMVQLASAWGDPTIPNLNDPFGHNSALYPPTANPNYNPAFSTSNKLQKRWQEVSMSSDGLTLVTVGPSSSPTVQNYGVITNVWLGHVPNGYGINLIRQGDTNAGSDYAIKVQGGFFGGIDFDTSKVSGVGSTAVDTNGFIIGSNSKSSLGTILYFPQNNTSTIFAIGCNNASNGTPNVTDCALQANGVDWAAVTPSRRDVNMTFGVETLYGLSVAAPGASPVPANLAGANPTPMSRGASTEAQGVGGCPLGATTDVCNITYIGSVKYDALLRKAPTVSAPVFAACTGGGIPLWGTAVGGNEITLTTDGTGVAVAANSLGLPAAKNQGLSWSVNMTLYERVGTGFVTWPNWAMNVYKDNSNSNVFTAGMALAAVEPVPLGLAPSATFVPAVGIVLKVTPYATATTWIAAACVEQIYLK